MTLAMETESPPKALPRAATATAMVSSVQHMLDRVTRGRVAGEQQRAPLVIAIVIFGFIVAAAIYALRGSPSTIGLLQVNGRVEGDLIAISPKVPGRVAVLAAKEGDTVVAGQVLAQLDDAAALARLAQAQASAEALDAQVLALDRAIELLRSESATGRAAARAGVAAAQADVRRVDAAVAQEERDLERARDLARKGFVGQQALERSALAARLAHEQRAAASAGLSRSKEALNDANLAPQRIRAREAERFALQVQAKAAWARVDEARVQVEELHVLAPSNAIVTNRYVNAGEVVAAGTPLFGLTDLSQVYLKVYAPEPMIGRVRLGQSAQIWSDAFPAEPFAAKVGYVASRAEFTPKEIRTVDERVKLVFEVRLYPEAGAGGKLLPGQPANAMIRWDDSAPWRRPQQ